MRKALFLAVCLVACGSSESGGGAVSAGTVEPTSDAAPLVCEPGKQIACACVGGAIGAQRCSFDGNDWGVCKCPEVDSGAVAPEQDAAVDSGAPEPADTGTQQVEDSSQPGPIDSAVPSVDANPNQICDGKFEILVPGPTACGSHEAPGRVKDLSTGHIWFRCNYNNCTKTQCYGYTFKEAIAYCESLGMRVPTRKELEGVNYNNYNACAFPCAWSTWIQQCSGNICADVDYLGFTMEFNSSSHQGVLCVK